MLHLQNVTEASVLVIRLMCLLTSVALDRTEWASSMREGISAKGGGGEAKGDECKVTKTQTNLQKKYIPVV